MFYILIYIGVFGLWMLIELVTAPSGYEDLDEFYLIKPDKKKASLNSNDPPPED